MIEAISGLPDNVVGIRASGYVSASDYETIVIPAVESRLRQFEKLRLLYQLGPEFKGFTAGAMWDDLKLGVAHWNAWEKIALVTDVDWVANLGRLFSFAMPCPTKVFADRAFEQATDWLVTG